MAGLADFLSSALTVGTKAADAHEAGVGARRKAETADLLERIKLARQTQQDALAKQLHEAQIGNYESLAADRAKPPEPEYRVENGQRINLKTNTAEPIAGYNPNAGLERVRAEAEARAKAGAKFRRPISDSGVESRRTAIRQAMQQARQKYMAGELGLGGMDPQSAAKQAMADAVEVYGQQAVQDAVGGAPAMPAPAAPSGAPAPRPTPGVQKSAPSPADVMAWRDANPRQPGESDAAYKARAKQAFGAQ